MNKQLAIGFHSLLLVGALLPFSPLMPAESLISEQLAAPHRSHPVLTAPEAEQVAFGRGAPRFRSGGGTR